MDFSIPKGTAQARQRFGTFLAQHLTPNLPSWMAEGAIPRTFFRDLGSEGWLGFRQTRTGYEERSALEQAVLMEDLSRISPGVAVAVLVQVSLGLNALRSFATGAHRQAHERNGVCGETLICLGNTESGAGSDVAAIQTRATKVKGGWLLNGSKAYVTNGTIADLAVITAVSAPEATANRRLSMYLVDLTAPGVSRTKLDKRVWIPSDLTRIDFRDVFVPDGDLLGEQGRGLQQVLHVFTTSRVLIAALTLGTAAGAFELALDRGCSRKAFGRRLVEFQSKAFEIADAHARIEAARLAVWKACWAMDRGEDFRLDASVAKYLTVAVARNVCGWAADLFGAASVVSTHPIHKYPMDAWASSLGEGTQDIQKLVIFRELMRVRGQALG